VFALYTLGHGSFTTAPRKIVANFPTTFRRIGLAEFDMLADHGYRVTKYVEQVYGLCGPQERRKPCNKVSPFP